MASTSDKGDDDLELEKLKTHEKIDDIKKEPRKNVTYKEEEKKSLTKEDGFVGASDIPVVVIEDNSERIISSKLYVCIQ